MDDDWGLHAIVRSCNKIATAPKPTTTVAVAVNVLPSAAVAFHSPDLQNQFHLQNENSLFFPDPSPESRNLGNIEDSRDLLFKPIFPKFQPLLYPHNIPISPLSVIGGLQDLSPPPPPPQQQQQQQQQRRPERPRHEIHPTPKSKRRKHQQKKKVCHVPAEGLSSDMWSWRKYGQKPIKGSPYPRGYYRCSTSKSCLARKQVERNRSDPSMFILTYTGEHSHAMPTHRNSLAGSTRQKPASTDTDSSSNKPSCSSPISSAASPSPAETPTDQNLENILDEEEEEEEEEFGLDGGSMKISDDFFEGLEDITGAMSGKCFSDGQPFSWPTNSVTTSAAGR